ncbi:2-C-methyl-D-erythritol 2,4-cyclodiphosphate synthase [Keratinibaculum paraultunense]|uniref:2-C-methyl-D-erythritol 2,4-cyclodiphosphate synthase n=1 Tax=Keratinibaculum paraultunense TaxID=1278232 RepID=A0A4R3KT74_9FIRM|nr:2-C-methyl-D-erythritol 2,4-cyclodiphosphate synthase [Keratinibaculum paraultunense]QQY79439.1 2-C-methyl-D-erythritol 2,4-cyclodiphosphate synthase [Keratinibaculum paraultunense]TCS88068.1 2-C-methyl-D-erythritol 2,4-cyclodiphosphate synthase [Keratinibaculum paraultunense]
MRIGIGYDVHKLVKDRKLIIGGVDIPYEKGLLGHSDADVLIHAIMDSILGALGQGDIGKHFPDTDDAYKDISSIVLLEKVYEILLKSKYKVGNIDCVIVAQKPKMESYIEAMKNNISEILNISSKNINIKATTTEQLGFEGREEGISAYSVCLLFEK